MLVSAPHQPAIAAQLGMYLKAAQIGIRYCYAAWHETAQAHVVFKTTDDDRAIRVLEACVSQQNQWTKCQGAHPGQS